MYETKTPNQLFCVGNRYPNALHARMRLNSTTLNCHLFKYGRSDTHECTCGNLWETVKHFMLECPNYATHRNMLLAAIRDILAPGTHPNLLHDIDSKDLLNMLLNGFKCDITENEKIFHSVQRFLVSSGRFSYNN